MSLGGASPPQDLARALPPESKLARKYLTISDLRHPPPAWVFLSPLARGRIPQKARLDRPRLKLARRRTICLARAAEPCRLMDRNGAHLRVLQHRSACRSPRCVSAGTGVTARLRLTAGESFVWGRWIWDRGVGVNQNRSRGTPASALVADTARLRTVQYPFLHIGPIEQPSPPTDLAPRLRPGARDFYRLEANHFDTERLARQRIGREQHSDNTLLGRAPQRVAVAISARKECVHKPPNHMDFPRGFSRWNGMRIRLTS